MPSSDPVKRAVAKHVQDNLVKGVTGDFGTNPEIRSIEVKPVTDLQTSVLVLFKSSQPRAFIVKVQEV